MKFARGHRGRTVLRDIAKMKKKMKLSYDKKTNLWKEKE